MKESQALRILKQAILLERRGWNLYRTVAGQTASDSVRQICRFLAGEEEQHIEFLSRQFAAYQQNGVFTAVDVPYRVDAFAKTALTESIRSEIDAAGYEAAALSAALELEKNALELYAGRAGEAEDDAEKSLYQMPADWERAHLDLLVKINQELTEDVWYDNQFWPF